MSATKNDKKTKSKKRKPKYGMLSCVGYIYRLLWNTERGLVFTGIFTVPISLILSALALYIPPLILSTIETSENFSEVALVIAGLLIAKMLFSLCNMVLSIKIGSSEHLVLMQMDYILKKKMRDRDWYLDFDPEVQIKNERAYKTVESNHSAGVHFPMDFSNMVSQILNFLLFGTVISMLHPVIILLLAIGCILNYLMSAWERKKNWSDRDVRNDLNRKISYFTYGLSDYKYAKDIRLYGMREPLHNHLTNLFALNLKEKKKLERRSMCTALENFLVILIRDGAAYAFLIYKATKGEVDAASFLLYFSAITAMSGMMGGILSTFNRVFDGAMQVSDFREAMEVSGRLNRGKGIPIPSRPFSIEFKNVSYKYPEGEKKVLDNISFRIEAGEKIALVGLNGAGKTTLTRLMCGLLLPDEGEILIDGHTLYEYNRDEMYSLFGIVPQNYKLLPVSIAGNIASATADEEIDRKKLEHCVEMAGLSEKIASLPMGLETPLNREVNRDGIELSGGETQKLLLARLLYKNPLCIILDEPTAALDPIAEDKLYRRYNEIAAHATSVFISHRLASTKFCNRIFLLDGANFAEVGSHDDLMKAKGKYWELFNIQSKYYQSEDSENEA